MRCFPLFLNSFSLHHRNPSTSTASTPSGTKTTPADKPRTSAIDSKSGSATPQTVKQKVSGSVADRSSMKQPAKTSTPEKTSKKATPKKDPAPKCKVPEKQCDTVPLEDKPTLEKCVNAEKESVTKEMAAVDKPEREMCSAEPEQNGENASQASEQMELECVADCKEENLITVNAEEREPSAEGSNESQPSTSSEIPAADTETGKQGRRRGEMAE